MGTIEEQVRSKQAAAAAALATREPTKKELKKASAVKSTVGARKFFFRNPILRRRVCLLWTQLLAKLL